MSVSFSSEFQSEYKVDWNKYSVKSRGQLILKVFIAPENVKGTMPLLLKHVI